MATCAAIEKMPERSRQASTSVPSPVRALWKRPPSTPAHAIPNPRNIIWAQEILYIGNLHSEYFLGPKNISWGSGSRGEERAHEQVAAGGEVAEPA
jgi:hypothetical protein